MHPPLLTGPTGLAISRRTAFLPAVAAGSLLLGIFAAWHFARLGLTLSHYDARGHLIVARRIFDSITPGWQQIGAVWLPLPHLLNAIPIQLDLLYRTGWSAVAISIASFVVIVASIAAVIRLATGSRGAAIGAALIFALNPNVLYLQSTPMTEMLLLALLVLGTALLLEALRGGASVSWSALMFAAACLTRYEAWPVVAAAIAAAAVSRGRSARSFGVAFRTATILAIAPATAIAAFLVFSRIVVGQWFVSSGFFVPVERSLGHPIVVAGDILWGVRALGGLTLCVAGAAGLTALIVRAIANAARTRELVAVALVASVALPFLAFLDGHPYRIRYMVPLLAAAAIGVGYLLSLLPSRRGLAALVLVSLAIVERPPLDAGAPMVVEAQWDMPNVVSRLPMTDYLKNRYRGETIMASMGSLGHYMQELSAAGFDVRDFLHEGNGDLWLRALNGPGPFVGWILIDEQGEGGDMLAKIVRENPKFLNGFSRVRDAAGIALYERQRVANVRQNRAINARQNRMLNVAR
jgi:hypothetical protein